MKKVGIAIPVANEEGSIAEFLTELLGEISGLGYGFRVYVVMDNFSRDNTAAIVRELAAGDGRIQLVFYEQSTGVASSYLQGFRVALAEGCDYIIEMDSGGSHPPARIKEVLVGLDQEGFDVIFMSRFLPGGSIRNLPLYRRAVSWGGTLLAKLWLGLNLSDATSGFEGFRANVLGSMNLDAFISFGHIFQTEMKYYCVRQGCKIKEIPFTYVGANTSFKPQWVWIALKTLFNIKYNRSKVLKPARLNNL
jgi:dolichol-phosphate mannosyltransferase